ncbi:unnamed protein product [Paramecium primaurelia]|uniref:E2 ubiquitin-conjugating enzyme n=1 Tax=Paramecium primaurelia TaxID=5886 RepID=A0A8S1MHN3_PARPR|nr:unnamed protein product [Paramecium primaurelia]
MARNNRILKEINTFKLWQFSDIKIGLIDQKDIKNLWASIEGPQETPYQDGLFNLSFQYPYEYPFKAPKIMFKTPIYHPNINQLGEISLDILFENWNPALSISTILLSIQSILDSPFLDNPIEPEIAWIYQNDRSLYNKTVRMWVKKYAQ